MSNNSIELQPHSFLNWIRSTTICRKLLQNEKETESIYYYKECLGKIKNKLTNKNNNTYSFVFNS